MTPKMIVLAITVEDEYPYLQVTEVLKLKNQVLDLRTGNQTGAAPNFERIPLQYGGNAGEYAVIAENSTSEIRISWEAF